MKQETIDALINMAKRNITLGVSVGDNFDPYDSVRDQCNSAYEKGFKDGQAEVARLTLEVVGLEVTDYGYKYV